MELLLVLFVVGILLVIAFGRAFWIWLGLLVVASVVEYRAYRVRCAVCGEKVLSGRGMKFCNQCGVEQTARRSFRMRCRSCKRMTRSELNMSYCNRCGAAVEPGASSS